MKRQNLFSDEWDGEDEEAGTRHRIFWRPDDARMGATLYELAPGAPEMRIHMHFGAEEMFFVLSGRPVFRNQHGEEELAPGDFVFCPEGRAGLHTFSNPSEEPAQILAMSAGSFPDVVAYPRARICMGGDSRSRSRATGERRRSRHHRLLHDPDRVIARPRRRSPEPKRPRERPLRSAGSGCVREQLAQPRAGPGVVSRLRLDRSRMRSC